jgi:hypothetical protein
MARWVSPLARHPVTAVLIRIGAALFLAAIALTPVAIVLRWPRAGGIWVAGYVVGIATVPIVAFAVLRAVNAIFGEERLLAAFIAYSAILVIVSIASAVYAFS